MELVQVDNRDIVHVVSRLSLVEYPEYKSIEMVDDRMIHLINRLQKEGKNFLANYNLD